MVAVDALPALDQNQVGGYGCSPQRAKKLSGREETMKTTLTATAALCALLTASTLARAQSAAPPKAAGSPPAASNTSDMDKLQDFKSTGAMKSIPLVPQDPQKAAVIEKTLSWITLPPGFLFSL